MGLRLVFVGDIHLGRRPPLGPAFAAAGLDPHALGPDVAWRNTVDAAIAQRAHAVVLAGDVVESLNDRFAAFGHLERGVARLVEAGIEVLGVAGNHDAAALPRLAALIPKFRLIGPNATWEAVHLERDGERVQLAGWSFPQQHHRESPLARPLPALDGSVPAIGVLHADLDASTGNYAPVARRDLEGCPVDAWLLGHVHAPSLDPTSRRPIGYLGSITGLDAGEPGPHGPWAVTIERGRIARLEHLPLAPLRWERLDVDVAALDASDDDAGDLLAGAINGAMRAAHAGLPATGALVAAACTVRLVGRSRRHRALRASVAGGVTAQVTADRVTWLVHALVDEAGPALDLDALARGNDPPGVLARLLLDIESANPRVERLLGDATRVLDTEAKRPAWQSATPRSPDHRARLRAAGLRVLEDLLAQGECAKGGAR